MKKNLLDIQQKIRDLDNKIQDISSQVSSIYEDIDDFRNKDIIKDGFDYKMIRLMSTYFPFGEHPLSKLKEDHTCQMYIKILLSLIHIDRESTATINRLIFVQWLINESKLNIKLEEYFVDSLKISFNTFEQLVKILSEEYKEYLIVDALMLANICGQANQDVLNYIVNLCTILKFNKKQVQILSIITSSILKQSIGKIKKEESKIFLDYFEKFKYYIINGNMKAELINIDLNNVINDGINEIFSKIFNQNKK